MESASVCLLVNIKNFFDELASLMNYTMKSTSTIIELTM